MEIQLGLRYTYLQWFLVFIGIGAVLFFLWNAVFRRDDLLLCVRNVFRNKRRSMLVLLAIAIAVMGNLAIGTYFLSAFYNLRESTIRSQTGHLVLMKDKYYEEGSSSPSEYVIPNAKDIVSTIKRDKELMSYVQVVTTQVQFRGIIRANNKTQPFVANSVNPEEDKDLASGDVYVQGKPLSAANLYEVVIGEGLAQQLGNVKVGDSVLLLGSIAGGGINALDATIGGIAKPISRDYSNVLVKTTTSFAQEMTLSEGANKIIIVLHKTKDTAKARTYLETIVNNNPQWNVQLYNWYQLQDFYRKVNGFLASIFVVVSSLLFGMIIFLVVNTMTMSVFERFREFGTIRVIGLKKRQLISMVLIESIVLSFIGVFVGVILSYVLGFIVDILQIQSVRAPGMTSSFVLDITPKVNFEGIMLLIMSIFAIIGIASLSAFFPGYKAMKLKLVDSLRHH